jgi:phosphoribosylanthranilate isomerase
MTWVKICGITNLEDALLAVEAGADALGFVFYDKSPRKIDVETARAIVEKLPEQIEKVGVLVGGSDIEWFDIVLEAGLTAVQHYPGPRSQGTQGIRALCMSRFPGPLKHFMAVIPLADSLKDDRIVTGLAADFVRFRTNIPEKAPVPEGVFDTFLLDSGGGQQPGGTGKTFNWRKAVPLAEGIRQVGLKLVVAGGLTAQNVGEAIDVLKPWGVDVSSGVESCPGKKDPEKVRAFIQAVRQTDGKKT